MVAGEHGYNVQQTEKRATISALSLWVKQQAHLVALPLESSLNWEPLGGDAGFRHYFRLARELSVEGRSLLAVWSPPATEKNTEFLQIAQFLRAHGIYTPEIYAIDKKRGFLLIEDLGKTLLLDVLVDENVDDFYHQASMVLVKTHQCPLDQSIYNTYDQRELLREMHLFAEWFVSRLLGYTISTQDRQLLEMSFECLCVSALEQPRSVLHRDFHSRNLVVRDTQPLGVIDFQDGVIGPITYDLVSLLRDCYIEWPSEQVQRWAIAHLHRVQASGLLQGVSPETFMRWFDWMGLQRHIKVLGIFARLYLRDGKDAYLDDLPLVVRYTRLILAKYPELATLNEWFEASLMPLIQQQEWMKTK